jgi:hypothetical protein
MPSSAVSPLLSAPTCESRLTSCVCVLRVHRYVIANKGIDTEARYPLASVWISDCTVPELCPCTYNRSAGAVGAVVASYTSLPAGSEASLEHALATAGPVPRPLLCVLACVS